MNDVTKSPSLALVTSSPSRQLLGIAKSDLKQVTLNGYRQRYGLSELELNDVLLFTQRYGAKPQKFLEIRKEHNLSIYETSIVYDIRDNSNTLGDGKVSLKSILVLRDRFPDHLDLENEADFSELIVAIACTFQSKYVSGSLKDFLAYSENFSDMSLSPQEILERYQSLNDTEDESE